MADPRAQNFYRNNHRMSASHRYEASCPSVQHEGDCLVRKPRAHVQSSTWTLKQILSLDEFQRFLSFYKAAEKLRLLLLRRLRHVRHVSVTALSISRILSLSLWDLAIIKLAFLLHPRSFTALSQLSSPLISVLLYPVSVIVLAILYSIHACSVFLVFHSLTSFL